MVVKMMSQEELKVMQEIWKEVKDLHDKIDILQKRFGHHINIGDYCPHTMEEVKDD